MAMTTIWYSKRAIEQKQLITSRRYDKAPDWNVYLGWSLGPSAGDVCLRRYSGPVWIDGVDALETAGICGKKFRRVKRHVKAEMSLVISGVTLSINSRYEGTLLRSFHDLVSCRADESEVNEIGKMS